MDAGAFGGQHILHMPIPKLQTMIGKLLVINLRNQTNSDQDSNPGSTPLEKWVKQDIDRDVALSMIKPVPAS